VKTKLLAWGLGISLVANFVQVVLIRDGHATQLKIKKILLSELRSDARTIGMARTACHLGSLDDSFAKLQTAGEEFANRIEAEIGQ
jgi:hypothetical protein